MALCVPLAFLLRVPLLGGHPAGALGGEPQGGPLHGLAAEDAVAVAQGLVQFFRGNVCRALAQNHGVADGVQAEAAQLVALVTPRVEQPVAAVADEALGRYGAFAVFTGAPRLVLHGEAPTLAERKPYGFKALRWHRALTEADDADAFHELQLGGAVQARLAQYLLQPLLQRLQVPLHQVAGLNFPQQLVQREQRQHFGWLEPQAGEFFWGVFGAVRCAP